MLLGVNQVLDGESIAILILLEDFESLLVIHCVTKESGWRGGSVAVCVRHLEEMTEV
jgi:hypothetical protein